MKIKVVDDHDTCYGIEIGKIKGKEKLYVCINIDGREFYEGQLPLYKKDVNYE